MLSEGLFWGDALQFTVILYGELVSDCFVDLFLCFFVLTDMPPMFLPAGIPTLGILCNYLSTSW